MNYWGQAIFKLIARGLPVLSIYLGGEDHWSSVAAELKSLGVVELLEGGPTLLFGSRVLGKGQNGVVVRCRHEVAEGEWACKLRRRDASRPSLLWEGYVLRLANGVGVGPRLLTFSRNVIVMEEVTGSPLSGEAVDAALARRLLEQARALDRIGVSHNELARGGRHVLVRGGEPVIIDFESATLGGRRSNVLQLLNALVRDPVSLRDAARRYKVERSDDAFRELVELVVGRVGPRFSKP